MFGRFGYRFGTSDTKLGWKFSLVYVAVIITICIGLVLAVQP